MPSNRWWLFAINFYNRTPPSPLTPHPDPPGHKLQLASWRRMNRQPGLIIMPSKKYTYTKPQFKYAGFYNNHFFNSKKKKNIWLSCQKNVINKTTYLPCLILHLNTLSSIYRPNLLKVTFIGHEEQKTPTAQHSRCKFEFFIRNICFI